MIDLMSYTIANEGIFSNFFGNKNTPTKPFNPVNTKPSKYPEILTDHRKRECIDKAIKALDEESKMPAVFLTVTNSSNNEEEDSRSHLLDSKFGGIPYWPSNMKWPTFKNEPMIAIAQLNLDKLPRLPDFPTTGLLQFFVHRDLVDYDECTVIYHRSTKNAMTNVPISTFTYQDEDFPIRNVSYLSGRLDTDHYDVNLDKYEEEFLRYLKKFSDGEYDYKSIPMDMHSYIYDHVKTANSSHKMNGFMFSVQDGSFDRNTEVLLLQIDSDDRADILWGDMGNAQFFITKQDLKAKRFNKAWFYWSCY